MSSPPPTICLVQHEDNSVSQDEAKFFLVMQRCFDLFVERNRERHSVWRRSGLRGQTFEVFAKAERAYTQVFTAQEVPNRDHYRDMINYSIFALILMDEDESRKRDRSFDDRERFKKLMHGEWPR